jgi:hypothetical protein
MNIEFNAHELQVIHRWLHNYLSGDMVPTPENAVRDMLKRIEDDMDQDEAKHQA